VADTSGSSSSATPGNRRRADGRSPDVAQLVLQNGVTWTGVIAFGLA
jgi:hypothetical protein